MKVYSPVKKAPYPINSIAELKLQIARQGQFFGEDKSGPACNFRPEYPCDKTLYQALGLASHNGLDIPLSTGTEVYAAHSGIIIEVSQDPNAGLGVVIFDKTQLIKTYYWHLESFPVKVGDEVRQGQVVGYADNTGLSSGSHLHFGLKETDQYGNSVKSNAYNGAIDPLPYMVWFDDMELVKLGDGKNIWIVRDGKRSLVYNVSAFQMIGGNIDQVKILTQEQFDAIPDSGLVLAGIVQE